MTTIAQRYMTVEMLSRQEYLLKQIRELDEEIALLVQQREDLMSQAQSLSVQREVGAENSSKKLEREIAGRAVLLIRKASAVTGRGAGITFAQVTVRATETGYEAVVTGMTSTGRDTIKVPLEWLDWSDEAVIAEVTRLHAAHQAKIAEKQHRRALKNG